MYKFTSTDTFNIARGCVFLVKNVEVFERSGPTPYMNQLVEIDGILEKVIGVETMSMSFMGIKTGPVEIGHQIALLVKRDV